MSLLVVGSIAYDNIKTPDGEVRDALGGSAVYFSIAASHFVAPRLVGVVGEDFDTDHVEMLRSRSVDASGLEIVPGGKTFRWTGEYTRDMNHRETLEVELNVFEDYQPRIPDDFKDSRFVFLANASPITQMSVMEQVSRQAVLVVADTMDLWIKTQRDDLLQLIERLDALVINDEEALLLSGKTNLIQAGREILRLGVSRVVVKKGDNGAVLFTQDQTIPLPAYPTGRVIDPTGAGDSFAGALMGFLARNGSVDETTLKEAIAHGTVAASFTVEDYGIRRIASVTTEELRRRYDEYRGFLRI